MKQLMNKIIIADNQDARPSMLISALSNWSVLIIRVIITFFLTPFIIIHLGKNGFGIWVLITSIIGYYGILDLGITSAITRYIATYNARKDFKSLNEIFCTSLFIFISIGAFIAIISIAVSSPLIVFFNISTQDSIIFKKVIIICGFAAGLLFLGNVYKSTIRAHEMFVISNFIEIIIMGLRTFLTVVFLLLGFGLEGVAFSQLISSILVVLLNYSICKHIFPKLKFKKNEICLSKLRTLTIYGSATTVAVLADILRFNLDSFVIGKFINLPAIAVYSIAALLIKYFIALISKGTQVVLTPRFSSLEGEGNRDQLISLFLKSLSVSSFLSFSAGALIFIFGESFIFLWVGEEFLGAIPVLHVLIIAFSIAMAQSPSISLVYAIKKHYIFAAASIIEGIINLILSIYFVKKYGILGVALGTAIPMLLLKMFLQPIYVTKILKISILKYWLKILPSLFFSVGVVFLSKLIPKFNLFHNEYISLGLAIFLYVALFISLYGFYWQLQKKVKI